jgi:hypothetical protein
MAYTKEQKAAYDKRYRAANQERIRARDNAYAEANRAKKAEYDSAYWVSNSARINTRKKVWRDKNREHVREKGRASMRANPGKFAEWRKAWIAANPERWAAICTARNMRRHASKLNATPTWLTREDHDEILRVYSAARELGHHVDHVVPLRGKNVSGLHVPWNLQTLPATANIKKSNHF